MPDAVDVVVQRASALLDFKRPDDARTLLTAAVANDPDEARLWSILARVEEVRRDDEACRTAAERALALDPDDGSAMATRVSVLLRTGRIRDAQSAADHLLEQRPHWSYAHLMWAFTHTRFARGRRSAADDHLWPISDVPRVVEALDRTLELEPHDAELHSDAARCFHALSAVRPSLRPRADATMARALELGPNHERVLLAAGTLAAPRDRVRYAARVLEQDPTSWEALRRVDEGVWSHLRVPVAVVTAFLACTVIGTNDAAGAGSLSPVAAVAGWVVTALTAFWMLAVEPASAVSMPWRPVRRLLRRYPHVAVALVSTYVLWLAGTVAAVLVLAGGVEVSSPAYGTVAAVLAVGVVLQGAAWCTVDLTNAVADVRSGRWSDPVATRSRLRWGNRWQSRGYVLALAALFTWGLTAFVTPNPGRDAATTVPTVLAATVFVAGAGSELVQRVLRRSPVRLAFYTALAVGFAVLAVRAAVLQVIVTTGSG